MNAKKFVAACTAAVLTLGFSLGASSVAFADEAAEETVETIVTDVVEEQEESTEQRSSDSSLAPDVEPAHHQPDHAQGGGGGSDAGITCNSLGYQKPDALDDLEGGIGSYGAPDIAWGSLSWNGKSVSWTINEGYTVDICVKGGNTAPHEATGETEADQYTHGYNISHLGFRVVSVPETDPECVVAVWEMPSWIGAQTPSWPQVLVAYYSFPCGDAVDAQVPDECGTQYQLDKYYVSDITSALLEGGFLNGPNNPQEHLVPGGWGLSYKLVKNADCEEATAVVTVAERDCFVGTSFVIDAEASENVTWGDPVIDEVEGILSITATANPGSKFEEGLEGVSDDRTQRTFKAPYEPAEDCELDAVVVPQVTWVDECVDELRLDLTPAAVVGVASFTVTKSENVSYSYTINGGAPINIVFPDGEDYVTVLVTPGDTVVVTAAAADGFQLPEGYEPFVKEFVESAFCLDLETGPATTASVQFTLGECEGDSTVELTDEGGVVWRINGVIVEGNATHALAAGTDVEVTATLAEADEEFPLGWTWSDPEQETSWEETVAASDPNCDPELLATTGVGSLAESLGLLAVLVTLAGMGLVARKHLVIKA